MHPAAALRGLGPSSGGGPAVAPASFYCPISMELMADPVMVATGEALHSDTKLACVDQVLVVTGNHGKPAT